MNTQEFSANMDVMLNSYAQIAPFGMQSSNQTIELNEYEKSVFLTEAQEEFIAALYNGKNSSSESFEETEELRRYLSNLIDEAELHPIETSNGSPLGLNSKSKFFTLPDNLWFITYESAIITDGKCKGSTTLEVFPAKQNEYHRLRKNPFRGVNDRRALRFDLSDNNVEIVSKYNVTSYYIRYLKKLKPIIVAPLDTETIRGENTVTECEINESLHRKILELAVQKALQSKGYNRNNLENR